MARWGGGGREGGRTEEDEECVAGRVEECVLGNGTANGGRMRRRSRCRAVVEGATLGTETTTVDGGGGGSSVGDGDDHGGDVGDGEDHGGG